MTNTNEDHSKGRDEAALLREDRFLLGTTVYLRPPDIESDVMRGRWHSWFNDPEITKHLVHGVFPMQRGGQAALVAELMEKRDALLLSVVDVKRDAHIGIVSLKGIDPVNRVAEIGIVMGRHKIPGAPLEAMALLMKHAFERLNLDMLRAGQHEGLWQWVNILSLIGFRIDGYRPNAGVRNRASYGVFLTSVCAEDFCALQSERGGDILAPSLDELLSKRSRKNPVDSFKEALNRLNQEWKGALPAS